MCHVVRRRTIPICCLMVLVLATGCGRKTSNRGAVRGEVTFNGQPIENGSILFAAMDGTDRVTTGGRIEKGRYRLSRDVGPSLGTNRVEIRATEKTGRMVQKVMAPAGEMMEETRSILPATYNNNSTLTAEIKSGDNVIDFRLTSKP